LRSRPDDEPRAQRERRLLESGLRHAAQPRGHGREQSRPGAAARRGPALHRTAHHRARQVSPRRDHAGPQPGQKRGQAQRPWQMMTNATHTEPAEIEAAGEHIAPAPRVSIQAFCETVETAAAVQAAGEDRRLAKAHLKIQMGGIAAAVEAYANSPTPNVVVIETESRGDDIL